MRPATRIPRHGRFGGPASPRSNTESSGEGEERFVDRPCYQFNRVLAPSYDDKHCMHCRFYLTAHCPHIDEFLDDVEDLSPE